MGDSVKVAVRVRPFNTREIDKGCKCVIKMSGNQTTIYDPAFMTDDDKPIPKEGEKRFTFDYSYWSFDADDSNYASQEIVFHDLGIQVLDNAWEGYNSTIFAYGQTGSGKSYSMLGYGADKGIIPRLCEEMFRRINENGGSQELFKVEVSFMEIYNEKIKDLLNPKNSGKLKVRNHPKAGVYVEDLSKIAVKSFAEIDSLMDEGSKARTVASTNMNATSSRSHAVFTIEFTHAKLTGGPSGDAMERVSKINLVDLAGSERVASTGATGVRLKEGANINKSLSALGKVISALASGKKGGSHIPYRDSVLTWLLKESLGGNSRTVMVAAISPADINYGETLSTLRYADNAKQIKNSAIINEDPSSKLIRELRAEVDALKNQLMQNGGTFDGLSVNKTSEEVTTLKEELAQREKLIAELNKSWEERLKEAQALQQERKAALEDMGLSVAIRAVSSLPHILNLNQDPLLSSVLLYYLKEGITKVGRHDASSTQDIQLNGLNIVKEHCIIEHKQGIVTIEPCVTGNQNNTTVPLIFINGVQVKEKTRLVHGCRLILGNNHIFLYNNPVEAEEASKLARERGETPQAPKVVDWDFAMKELASVQGQSVIKGVDLDSKNKGAEESDELEEEKYRQQLKENIMQVILLINEANAISEALNKNVIYELKLISSFPGVDSLNDANQLKKTKVGVKLTNKVTKSSTVWSYETFLDRIYEMRELYQNFMEYGVIEDMVDNPFDVLYSQEELVGVAHLYLKKLLYLFEISRKLPILDSDGQQKGKLQVEVTPYFPESDTIAMNAEGSEVDTKSLLGKKVDINIKILSAIDLPISKYNGFICKFKMWGEDRTFETDRCGIDMLFNYERTFTIQEISEEFLEYLETNAISFEVWGKQANLSIGSDLSNEELLGSVNILEQDPLNDSLFLPVPIKEEHKETDTKATDQNQQSIFYIRTGQKHQIVLKLFQSDIKQCLFACISKAQLKKYGPGAVQLSSGPQGTPSTPTPTSSSSSTLSLPQQPGTPMSAQQQSLLHRGRSPSAANVKDTKEAIRKDILQVSDMSSNSVTLTWVTNENSSPLLLEKTIKGYIVSITLEVDVLIDTIDKPIHMEIPISIRVLEPQMEFRDHAKLLTQAKGRLIQKTSGELFGSLFAFKISRTQISNNDLAVIAMIDEHQKRGENLLHAIQIEKLKQELELHEKLSPSKPSSSSKEDLAKKDIVDQISHLSKTQNSNIQTNRRRTTSVVKANAKEVRSTALQRYRDTEISGFLNKKSAFKNKWRKFWFVLSRPYLYYYTNKELENEKVIDLTHSVIVPIDQDDQIDLQAHPFSFGIVTWKRLWVLEAFSQMDMNKWMKKIDPNLTTKEDINLKEKLELTEKELKLRLRENHVLNEKLSDAESMLKEQMSSVDVFSLNITQKLHQLKSSLTDESRSRQRKENELVVMREHNQKLMGEIISLKQQLGLPIPPTLQVNLPSSSQDSVDDGSSTSTPTTIPTLTGSTDDLKTQQVQLPSQSQAVPTVVYMQSDPQDDLEKQHLQHQVEKLKKEVEWLNKSIHDKELQHQNDISKIKELSLNLSNSESGYQQSKDTNDSLIKKNKDLENQLQIQSERCSRIESELRQFSHADERIKELQAELSDRSFQLENMAEKLKYSEDEQKKLLAQMDTINDKFKAAKEEVIAKDQLLNEKFIVKLPSDVEKSNWLPFSGGATREGALEKHLLQYKKANLAHSFHNSFLNNEILRLEKEMKLQMKLREQTIDRLKKEITLLRRRLLNLSRDRSDSVARLPTENLNISGGNLSTSTINANETTTVSNQQVEALKKRYFMSHALGVKLNLTFLQGMSCNSDIEKMYEDAIKDGIVDWEEWPGYIEQKMQDQAVPIDD